MRLTRRSRERQGVIPFGLRTRLGHTFEAIAVGGTFTSPTNDSLAQLQQIGKVVLGGIDLF